MPIRRTPDRAFADGFRAGIRSVVTGRSEPPHLIVRRLVGSPETDRVARHEDMRAFGADVDRGREDGLRG